MQGVRGKQRVEMYNRSACFFYAFSGGRVMDHVHPSRCMISDGRNEFWRSAQASNQGHFLYVFIAFGHFQLLKKFLLGFRRARRYPRRIIRLACRGFRWTAPDGRHAIGLCLSFSELSLKAPPYYYIRKFLIAYVILCNSGKVALCLL